MATGLQAASRSWPSSGAAPPVTSGQEALCPLFTGEKVRSRQGWLPAAAGLLGAWGHAVCPSRPLPACLPGGQGPGSAWSEAAGPGAPCVVTAAPGLQRGSHIQRTSLPGVLQPDSRATASAVLALRRGLSPLEFKATLWLYPGLLVGSETILISYRWAGGARRSGAPLVQTESQGCILKNQTPDKYC